MMFVEVRVSSLELLSHMAEMRVWLDSRSIDAARFSYNQHVERAIARVAFKNRGEAEAFAARFSGRIIRIDPSAVEIAPPLMAAPAWIV